MKCPRCQHENPAGVKFCGECGARLESLCLACQAANPPTNKFCHQCGEPLTVGPPAAKFASPQAYTPKHLAEKILTSKSALEGERKQVTVLFAENQVLGDGIMALFGAPLAHGHAVLAGTGGGGAEGAGLMRCRTAD